MLLLSHTIAPLFLTGVYDPPCDPGFNCEGLSDDAIAGGVIFWGLVAAGFVLLVVAGFVGEYSKKFWWRFRYGSSDGVKNERELLEHRGFRDFRVTRQRTDIKVTWTCSICQKLNFWVPFEDVRTTTQAEACKSKSSHPPT